MVMHPSPLLCIIITACASHTAYISDDVCHIIDVWVTLFCKLGRGVDKSYNKDGGNVTYLCC